MSAYQLPHACLFPLSGNHFLRPPPHSTEHVHETEPFQTGEKAREQKEVQDREARNQALAGSTYSVPLGSDLADEDHLSGLPWGGLNIPHMVQRGHESASQRGSRRGDSQGQYYDPQLSFGGSGVDMSYGGYEVGDDRYFTNSACSSSPSYFSYDAFSGDGGSQTGSGTRR